MHRSGQKDIQGVIITAIVWATPHLFNVFLLGMNGLTDAIVNTLSMFFVGIFMGILFRKTRSSFGPQVFWTLANGTSL
jgi:membrane protease YdiL (CAAX protease family)